MEQKPLTLPSFESTYFVEHITYFTLLDPTPLLSLDKDRHSVQSFGSYASLLWPVLSLHVGTLILRTVSMVGTRQNRWFMLSFAQLMWGFGGVRGSVSKA